MEDFDFWEVCFEEIGLLVFAFEVVCEFGDVVDFNIVFYVCAELAAWTAPAVVVGFCVVAFVSFLLRRGEFEEVLGECELSVDLLLGEAVVLHVELVTCQKTLDEYVHVGRTKPT